MNKVYKHHHRQWWCQRQMFYQYKRYSTLLNILSLLITSLGLVIGPVLQNVLLTAILAAVGMFIKGWNDFKKFSLKMDMSRFAYSTHAKAMLELRHLQSTAIDDFLLKQQILQDVIIDFAPPIPDSILRRYKSQQDEVDGQNAYKEQSQQSDTTTQSCQDENSTEGSSRPSSPSLPN